VDCRRWQTPGRPFPWRLRQQSRQRRGGLPRSGRGIEGQGRWKDPEGKHVRELAEKKTLALPAGKENSGTARAGWLGQRLQEKKTLALPAGKENSGTARARPSRDGSDSASRKRKLWHCPRHAPAARNSRSALAGCVLAAAARIVSPSPTVSMFPIAVGAKATRCASKEPSGKSTARWPITHSARAAPAPASETPSAQVGRATAGKQPVAR